MWSRIRPRCAISLGKSIVVAYSNSRSPREYEFATDTSIIRPERFFVLGVSVELAEVNRRTLPR